MIREGLTLDLKAQLQNTFNTVVLIGSMQSGNVTNSTFGQDTGLTQNNAPRFIRLKAVLSF
jgi:hypothetical protein